MFPKCWANCHTSNKIIRNNNETGNIAFKSKETKALLLENVEEIFLTLLILF